MEFNINIFEGLDYNFSEINKKALVDLQKLQPEKNNAKMIGFKVMPNYLDETEY